MGRYFSQFCESHYVANEDLQTRYPEDTAETLGTVAQLYHRPSPGHHGAATDRKSTRLNSSHL